MYLFFKTWSTSRGGLAVGMEFMPKNKFVEEVDKKCDYHKSYWRYVKLTDMCGSSCLLKDMCLEEFEDCFNDGELTKEQVTNNFRKEISLKYGLHKEKSKLKYIPKKDLVVGGFYEQPNGEIYVNLGRVKGSYTYQRKHPWSNTKVVDIGEISGLMYSYYRSWYHCENINDLFIHRSITGSSSYGLTYNNTQKSSKKFIKKHDMFIDVPRNLEIVEDGSVLKIEFLDVKEK